MISRPLFTKSFILITLAVLTYLLGFFPHLVKKYYSTGIYPYISSALRFISSLVPFALGDIVYALLTGYVLYKAISLYRKRRKLQIKHRIIIPLHILNFLLILYIIFKAAWGLNYSRPGVSDDLGIKNEKYSVKELVLLGRYFIDKTNSLKAEVQLAGNHNNLNLYQLEQGAKSAYDVMAKRNVLFNYSNPCLKPVLNSWIVSKAGIEGYYAPLTGEANMNMYLPDFVKPYVSCHEIAHQLGIAYEDEANLLGYLTASNSFDVRYQYSANYEMLRYILFEIRMKSPEDYKLLHDKISKAVLVDFNVEKQFWRKYNGQMFGYMDKAFDSFLKLNNQPKGIDSYQDIVIWLWNLHKSEITKSGNIESTTHVSLLWSRNSE